MAAGNWQYCLVETPWGTMAIIARGRRLAEVVLPVSGRRRAACEVSLRRLGAVCAKGLLPGLVKQVGNYFGGRSAKFTVPVDLSGLTQFQRRVLAACRRIPAGRVVSYGELARRVGRPGAARAVGRVMAGNPLPLIIPCHRVVAAGGRLGGFSAPGGQRFKARLLAHERRHFVRAEARPMNLRQREAPAAKGRAANEARGKIRLGISSCLLGEPVRYDGGHKREAFLVETLGRYVEWVPVCPEVECGLTVPREAMRLVGDPAAPRLLTVGTGVDHTARMLTWGRKRVRELESEGLCGFVFKSRSPSCGMERVKVYDSSGNFKAVGMGLFARAFMKHFPQAPVEDEARLRDPAWRENFIEHIFR